MEKIQYGLWNVHENLLQSQAMVKETSKTKLKSKSYILVS